MARVTENNTAETGIIREEDFSVIMAQAFATYGLSVVTDRALPDARDGLKPVQRRILAGMREARYLSSRPTVKSAEVVGLILGNYHPHGDTSVYDAAVRMAQPFTLRYPLIEGQGNMGSEDGDAPAAYRYTEMRLSPLAEALMADMERDTVPLHPTYKQDPKVVEPDYLPGRIPPVVNPSSGIAVGLSTNIPPHNLSEVLRACIALLDRPNMDIEQLMTYIQGPDFCQGGRIIGIDGIKDYFTTGKGRIIVRAEERLHIVEGLIVGAAHADKVVKIFQQAEDRAAARQIIEKTYKLTPIQSEVIASMTLAQVTRLDASKYAKEKEELQARISELERLLSDRKALIALLKKEMQQLIKQFGDERRTTIDVEGQIHEPIKEVASLHEREPLVLAFTLAGALKVLPADTYAPKGKNGAAVYTP